MISYFPVVTGSLTVSGSVNISGGITASGGISIPGSIASASYAASASNALAAQTASYVLNAQSASNAVVSQTASYADTLTVAGTLTAQTLVVQTITSSVDFVTGSTRFGSLLDNTHVFSGSVTMNPGGLFVSSSGRVGIGTTNPNELFEVFSPEIAGTSQTTKIRIAQAASVSSRVHLVSGVISGSNPYFAIEARQALTPFAIVERLRIDGSGNVGIGTTNPLQKLNVNGGNIRIDNSGLTEFIINNGTSEWELYMPSGSTDLRVYRGTDKVTFLANGSVGIGTTSPSRTLDVRGAARIGGSNEPVVIGNYTDSFTGFYSTITSNNHGDLTFGSNQTIDTYHNLVTTNNHGSMKGAAIVFGGNGYTLGANTIGFFAQAAGTATAGTVVSASVADVVIKAGGYVGIGTTNPGYTLTVNGSTYSGTSNTMNNSYGSTGGQAAQVVSQEFGGTSFAVNLATLLPNYTFSGRALSVVMHVVGVSDSSNGSSTLVNAYRSIGGTWVINTVNTAQNGTTFINSITGSGTTITVNWNTTAFGVAYITVINRG